MTKLTHLRRLVARICIPQASSLEMAAALRGNRDALKGAQNRALHHLTRRNNGAHGRDMQESPG